MLHWLALLALQQPAPPAHRLIVTPAAPVVTTGDTLRLRAHLVDASGQPVSGARISFVATGFSFEARIDSAGLIESGAVGTFPVTAVAFLPGGRAVTQRVQVRIVPGPAARIAAQPASAKLLAGQRLPIRSTVTSAAGDKRDDRVEWSSSAPGVAQVNTQGTVTGMAAGRATLTARVGTVRQTIPVEVVSADVASIQVLPEAPTARTGDVLHFRALVRDRAGREIAGLTPAWLIAPGHGSIDEDGSFVGYRPGTYRVSASFGTRSAESSVTLEPRDVGRSAKLVGKVLRTEFPTSEVWIHPNGRVAYLGTALGGDRVYVIDVSNPQNPVVVDSLMVNARSINDIMTTPDGNYLVVTREGAADRRNGIVIADTRDPLRPKLLSEFTNDVTAGVHS